MIHVRINRHTLFAVQEVLSNAVLPEDAGEDYRHIFDAALEFAALRFPHGPTVWHLVDDEKANDLRRRTGPHGVLAQEESDHHV